MKAKTEALTQAIYPISAKMYQEAQAAGEAGQAGGESAGHSAGGDDVVDADFEVKDDK